MAARLTLDAFAAAHKLKATLDEDRTPIIKGREGHLYEYGNRLGLMVIGEHGAKAVSPLKWGFARNTCERAGMEVLMDGECEGALAFDPRDGKLAKLAIKVAGARAQRARSVAQIRQAKALERAGTCHRFM
ncbi:MAG: hypothetical protein ABSG84_12190 [Acidobacteriaceae bacterium]|jgi:hypothetical protein